LLAVPQLPLTIKLAEHVAVEPEFNPVQDQLQGPVPVTVVAVPVEQRSEEGIELKF